MNWLDTSVDFKSAWAGGTDEQQIDWEAYDLIVAVGPTVDMGGWNLYGGPFYYMLDGDLDLEGSETWATGYGTWEGSGDLEEDSSFGAFVGAQCTVMEKYDVTTELSITGDGWAIGAGIAVPF
jgi:hypothetical protein